MIGLNILQQADGSIAWFNIILLLALPLAAWLLARSQYSKKNSALQQGLKDSQDKSKLAENELKSYKSRHEASFRQQEKSLSEMTARVKSLEGDIKVLAEEKQKTVQLLHSKEEEIKNYMRQSGAMDDKMKALIEEHDREMVAVKDELKSTKNSLAKALEWEKQARQAEEEARQAKNAFNDLQRKTLEFDLRLKAASEYAARVKPLEEALLAAEEKYNALKSEVNTSVSGSEKLSMQLKETIANLNRQQEENADLKKSLGTRQEEISALGNKLSDLSVLTSKLAALDNEMMLLRESNATLQQELAEKSARLREFETQPAIPKSPLQQQEKIAGTKDAIAESLLISEEDPGQGEES